MKSFVASLLILFSISAFANHKQASEPYVNVLTWWGYLDSPWISKEVQSHCHAKLSYDSYSTNDEMIRILQSRKKFYDILIFSYTNYADIKNEITLENSDLYKVTSGYLPLIKKHYDSNNFPPNIVYFDFSLTGFIWNPNIINLTQADTVKSLFSKAGNDYVVLVNDPTEMTFLLTGFNSTIKEKEDSLEYNNFKKIIGNANVVIMNNTGNVYNQPNFAAAYQWSGIAVADLKEHPGQRFLINKNLTYISSDMIAQLKDKQAAVCVSNYLASKEFLDRLMAEAYYFSPYGEIKTPTDPMFSKMYINFLEELPNLQWLSPMPQKSLQKLDNEWLVDKYYIDAAK